MKYKVGDKVRIVSKWVPGCHENHHGKMDKYLGTIMTIREVHSTFYLMEEDIKDHMGIGWMWSEPAIAGLVSATFTKKDLKNGDIVLQRNGVVQIYNDTFKAFITKNWFNYGGQYRDDLTSCNGNEYDIVAVRRPLKVSDCVFSAFDKNYGELVYDRERDTVVEMTMEEICAALGKTIKIVKE